MDIGGILPRRFLTRSRTIGNDETVWCGIDIRDVLTRLCESNAIILGIESVTFPWEGSGPRVEAISDASNDILAWQKCLSREAIVRLSRERAIADIERTVPNPYGDDVWYCVVADLAS